MIPAAWLLITLSLVGPQAALALTSSKVLAILLGLIAVGLLGIVLMRFAPTRESALVGVGIICAMAGLTGAIGTPTFQLAATLSRGKALDGVTMSEALQLGEEGTWVRLTDARALGALNGPAVPNRARLSAAAGAWCVQLDPSLDANAAKANALSTTLAFLLVLPLFGLGVLAVALSKSKEKT